MNKLPRWQYIIAGLLAAFIAIVGSRLLVDRANDRIMYEVVWFLIYLAAYFAAIYIMYLRIRRGQSLERGGSDHESR